MSRIEPSPLRTRTRADDEDAGLMRLDHFRSTGDQWYQVPYAEFSVFDQMTDRLNPIGANGFRLPGPCRHTEIRASGKLVTDFTQPEWVGGQIVSAHYTAPHPHLSLSRGEFETAKQHFYELSFPANLLQEFKIDAWNKWKTQIPEDISLANFAYELTDFKYIGDNFKKQKKWDRDLNWKYRVRKRFGTPKDVPTMANSCFLNWNFGWAPFLGDLQHLASLYDTISKRIDFLRKNRKKPVRMYYSREIQAPSLEIPFDVHTASGGGNSQYRRLIFNGAKQVLTASCTLVQDIPELETEWGRLKATLAATGFNNPAKIVWNAIPFSFMVDWIVPMQGLLEHWTSVNPFVGQWDIFDVSHSVKTVGTWTDVYEGVTSNGGTYPTFIEMRDVVDTSFERFVGMPLTPEAVTFASLTSHQQRLFLSLIAGATLFKEKR